MGKYKKALESLHNMALNSCAGCVSQDEQSYAAKILKITAPLVSIKQTKQEVEG